MDLPSGDYPLRPLAFSERYLGVHGRRSRRQSPHLVLLPREISAAPSRSRVTRVRRAFRVPRHIRCSRRRRSLPSRQPKVRWIRNRGLLVFRIVGLPGDDAARLRQIAYRKKRNKQIALRLRFFASPETSRSVLSQASRPAWPFGTRPTTKRVG